LPMRFLWHREPPITSPKIRSVFSNEDVIPLFKRYQILFGLFCQNKGETITFFPKIVL
jgi:hypothetical protein